MNRQASFSPPPVNPGRNASAIASLVLGISSWVLYVMIYCFNLTFGTLLAVATYGVGLLCLLPLGCIAPVMWIAAVVTGHSGLVKAKAMNGTGRGMAITGLVTGYLGLGMMLGISLLVVVVFLATGSWTFLDTILPASPEWTF